MDELEIQGKKYISSKRAAELTGYAKDYVGQLSREGKISATRVGRAWYVLEEALLAHKGAEEAVEIHPEAIQSPSIRAFQGSRLVPLGLLKSNFKEVPKTWSTVRYFHDDAPMFPILQQTKEEKEPEIEPEKEFSVPISITLPKERVSTRPGGGNLDGVIFEKRSEIVLKNHVQRTKSKNINTSVQALVFSALVLAVFSGTLTAGLVLSRNFGFETDSLVSASALAEYSKGFTIGLDFLKDFFLILRDSFVVFFQSGLNFVVELASRFIEIF